MKKNVNVFHYTQYDTSTRTYSNAPYHIGAILYQNKNPYNDIMLKNSIHKYQWQDNERKL